MPIRINGSTSGYVELAAPAVAGTTVLTLPTDSIQPGMVLVNTTTFSATASVSVDSCFTSTYANYVIVARTTCTSDSYARFRLRASGTDYSGAQYQNQQLSVNSTTLTGSREADQTAFYITDIFTPPTDQQVFLASPQAAAVTTFNTTYCSFAGSIITPVAKIRAGALNTTTQYDGFTYAPNAGTITGTIRIYGLRN
jgi:hypothetical protein